MAQKKVSTPQQAAAAEPGPINWVAWGQLSRPKRDMYRALLVLWDQPGEREAVIDFIHSDHATMTVTLSK